MTKHYRWDTTLDERRRDDPGIDDPARRAAARGARRPRDVAFRNRDRLDLAPAPHAIHPGGQRQKLCDGSRGRPEMGRR